MPVLAATHEVDAPHDPTSGQPSGKRMHKPFTVTKEVDRSSPLLYSELVTSETLTDIVITFWSASTVANKGAGAETPFYTVKLTNARIDRIASTMPNVKDTASANRPPYENVSFIYEKIEWDIKEGGGVSALDSWRAQ